MNMTARTSTPGMALLLGLSSGVPFIAGGALVWLEAPPMRIGLILVATLGYGAIVLSFLGGVRFGVAMSRAGSNAAMSASMLSAGLPALAGWIALLAPPIVGTALLIAGFLVQALWDVMSVQAGRLPHWYGRLRLGLTFIAVIALLSILARLLFTAPS